MPARVELVLGNVVDSDAPFIALPCSTAGTISSRVEASVRRLGISFPANTPQFRQRKIFALRSPELRKTIVWVPSVTANDGSSVAEIAAYAEQLGHLLSTGAIQASQQGSDFGPMSIAAPLLGTGAGNLRPLQSFVAMREGFEKAAPEDACLRIHALSVRDFEEVRSALFVHLPPELPEDLISACAEGDCVVYAGSGLSAPAGLPLWAPFVEQLLNWAVEHKIIDPTYEASLREACASGDSNIVADAIVSRVSEAPLRQFLTEVFADRKPTPVHHLLPRLGLAAALTTNFDDLLETAYASHRALHLTPQDGEKIQAALGAGQFFVLKLYGTMERPGSLLVAPAQYQETVSRNVPFARAMDALFSSKTILFLGSSLEGIDAYLGGIGLQGNPDQTPRRHYALVNVVGEAWRARADLLSRRYNIHVIPYTVTGHEETLQFLQRLADRARPNATAPVHPARETRLKSVHLKGVGPFQSIELQLDPEVTLLVGDNGVGKSSILRAIAACLVGEDAAPYATRLVRTGQHDATISLTTDAERTYNTQIFLSGGTASVKSRPARPLDSEHWLALGFPAVRLFTWSRPGELLTSTGGPTSVDLIPLLSPDPDTRLDRIKQWVFTQQYLILRNQEPWRERLLKDFFEILDRVMPGLGLEFSSVDPSTREVRVRTGGGDVSFEAVSQGTAALVGWIGILLQRLYDAYPDDPNPRERFALLLIDEIDAHMHPLWQQGVLRVVRESFPKVQIVATTHSPLLVSGLKHGQIAVLRRDPDGGPVELSYPDEDFSMMRADQILTSATFGLPTTVADRDVIDRYTELASKVTRTKKEEEERIALRTRISVATEINESPKFRSAEALFMEAMTKFARGAPLPTEYDAETRRRLREELSLEEEPMP